MPHFTFHFLLISGLLATNAHAERVLLDRVAADVGGKAVLYSRIAKKLQRGQDIVVSEYPAVAGASDFEKSLNDEINFQLIMQKSEELEITVEDQKLDAAIEKFVTDQGSNMDALRESLRHEGLSFTQYREDFRNQMILSDFQGRVIMPLVKVPEKDVENYFLRKTGVSPESVVVQLRQLIFNPDQFGGDKKATQTHADEVYAQLKSGMKFDDAFEKYNKLDSQVNSKGRMAEIKTGELAADLRDKIENLAMGEFSAPADLGGSFVIFYVENRKLGSSSEFAALKPKLQKELTMQQLMAQTISWLAEQRRRVKPRAILI